MANPNLHENKLKRALVSPFRNLIKKISKRWYVASQYRYITHHKLNLKNPTRYTEKLQYLRLFIFPKILCFPIRWASWRKEYIKKRVFATS